MNEQIIISTPIAKTNYQDSRPKLLALIRWAYNKTRKAIEKDDAAMIAFDADELFKDFQLPEFKNMTLENVRDAFQFGLSLRYGEFYGLNCVTYMKWIRAYLEEQKKPNGLSEHDAVRLRLAQSKEPTQEEKEAISKANIETIIETYKIQGVIVDLNNSGYYYLWQIGEIRFDEAHFVKLMQEAKSNLETEIKAEIETAQNALDKIKVNEFKRQLENLSREVIKREARRLAMLEWVQTKI